MEDLIDITYSFLLVLLKMDEALPAAIVDKKRKELISAKADAHAAVIKSNYQVQSFIKALTDLSTRE
jgi:hypothetical protein